jgi:hypothetical protein
MCKLFPVDFEILFSVFDGILFFGIYLLIFPGLL